MKKSQKISFIAVGFCILIGFAAVITNNYKTKTSFKYKNKITKEETIKVNKTQDAVVKAINKNTRDPKIMAIDRHVLEISKNDIVYGDPSAPVTMIEYSSLSCPHCAAFNNDAFDRLNEEYIKTKKMKFIHRDFPLNNPALAASLFAICQAEDSAKDQKSEKYYNLIKALFKTQESWAFDPKYIEKLTSIARLDGMTPERFKECIDDKKIQQRVLTARMAAAKGLNIKSTPTFFINGEVMEGYADYLSIQTLIDAKLAQTQQTKH